MEYGTISVGRKRALRIVLLAAAILLILILIRSCVGNRLDPRTPEGREQYLTDLGWSIDPDSEEEKTVLLPETLEGVMADYNQLQRDQGFDLEKYLGKSCTSYSYRLLNYPDCEDEVYVTLYVLGRRVIAGDIHTNALDGFMHGIYPQ